MPKFFAKFWPSANVRWGLLFLAALVFTREVNFTRYLTGAGISNYVDILLSPAWLVLSFYAVRRSLKLNSNRLGLLMTWNLLVAWPITMEQTYWWLHTWIVLLGYLLVKRRTWKQVGWVLFPVFLFDHALLSSPYPVVMLLGFQLLKRVKKLRFFYPVLAFHLLLAAWQILTGEAFGFYWLGEKYLDLETPGVAKTVLGSWEILRGYGLFAHPLILGVFGLLGVRFLPKNLWLVWGLLGLSQSRAAWLSGLGLLRSRRIKIGLGFSLLALFLLRLSTSDSYRFADLEYYLRFTSDYPETLLFGTGAGQYAQRLQVYTDLANFQYQPVHSIPLLLLVELGLLPLAAVGLYSLWRWYRNFTKR